MQGIWDFQSTRDAFTSRPQVKLGISTEPHKHLSKKDTLFQNPGILNKMCLVTASVS